MGFTSRRIRGLPMQTKKELLIKAQVALRKSNYFAYVGWFDMAEAWYYEHKRLLK